MGGALEGIRVVELGEGVSAPYCAKLFADYGADVAKVEPPTGDIARGWGPFANDTPHPEKSGTFHFLNTNKRSVILDLDDARQRARLADLIDRADVLIENQPLAKLRRWGLLHDDLAERNPELVTVSISPFGRTGPYAEWKGCDLNAFHLTGSGSRYCGKPDRMPLEQGTWAADFFGAVAGASWGLAAVHGRETAGGGQLVDVSCAEVVAATFTGGQNVGAAVQTGRFDIRTGIGMSLAAPATIMPCRDGHVWMLTLETAQWRGLVEVMGNPEWARLEMFDDMFERARNQDLIYTMLAEWTAERGKFEIMEQCQAAGCPITAVFTVEEAATHPHLRERGYLIELEDSELGRIEMLGRPFRLSATPGGPRTTAPRLGAHTRQVLDEIAGTAPLRDASAKSASRAGSRAAAGSEARAPGAASGSAPSRADAAPPLEGIRVANFGWVWAGPVTGQTLSFLGAEVYKIESHARVDMTRTLPPFGNGVQSPNHSLSNHACWAGNGSVSLNLKKDEAVELAREIVATSDVVIENFGPGVMERFGLGYDELRAVKPDLVMFRMPAAGLDGPMKDVRTYGLSLTSTTGLDSLTGYGPGEPIPFENAYSDPFSGVFGAFAVLAALRHRDLSGQGQLVDFSQQEAVMQMVGPAFMDYSLNRRVAGPIGNKHPGGAAAPHCVFPCAGEDRWISIAVFDDAEWQGLKQALGDPAWARDARFTGPAERLANIEALHEALGSETARYDDRELALRLQRHGVPAAPVLTIGDLTTDPHYAARGTYIEVDHPLGFRETIYGSYVKLGRSPVDVRPGPVIGQDNEKVFLEILGMDRDRYARLVADEVIY